LKWCAEKWQLSAFPKNNSMKARVCATNNRVHAKQLRCKFLISLCFLCIGKAYLYMKLQYGCTHNFSCANKNFLEPFYCILNHSATNQSTYDQFPPNNSFLLPRSASDKFTTGFPRSKGYIGKIIFSQKGFFVKTIAQQASSQKPITKLYSRLYYADSGAFFSPLFRF